MYERQYFNVVSPDAIDDQVIWTDDELARSGYTTTAVQFWVRWKCGNCTLNAFRKAMRCMRIFHRDEFDNLMQI